MDWKTRRKIRKYHPMKRAICEVLDGDWETHGVLTRIGIAILLVAYRENETGIQEAPNVIPYLENAGIKFDGKQLRHCLDVISKNELIKDGKVQLETEGDTSGIEWAMAACLFEGWLQRIKKNGEWYYKNTDKGMKTVEKMLKP